MKKTQKKLIIANWKMNPGSINDARKLFLDSCKATAVYRNVKTVIAAPFPYLFGLEKLSAGKRIKLAAQDVFYKKEGPYTGEVSVSMLKSLGVTQIIVGHSERRALGETDEEINAKLTAVIKSGLMAVLCVGESERDHHGRYLGFVENQVKKAFLGVPRGKLGQVVVAYEPVWALSTTKGGHTATPEDAHEMMIFIQKILVGLYGRASAEKVRILYGGSVDPKNIQEFLERSEAEGYIVGGASLKAKDIHFILKAVHEYRSG